MKICFCGLGSIGKRHIVNLVKILKERNITYRIDALRSSNVVLPIEISQILNKTYTRWQELDNDYDIVFVTNPTAYHYDAIQKLVSKTKHMFIEKPIFERTDLDLSDIEFSADGHYYVACPLRYSPVIRFIKNYIINQSVFSVRAICSSYLPDWRKGVDYRKVYSSIKEQGGGVSLDLIHEWDYLTYLFGRPYHVEMMSGKFSSLEINSEDIAIYIARFKDKLVELHLDYFGRFAQREILLYTADDLIKADILRNEINFYVSGKRIKFENEDIYLNEMNQFLDIVLNNSNNTNTPENAFNTLKIALGEK